MKVLPIFCIAVNLVPDHNETFCQEECTENQMEKMIPGKEIQYLYLNG